MRGLSRLILVALILLPGAALADAIDGTWCAPVGGRVLRIAGPFITTPGGQPVIGTYNRHDGSYVIPAGEAGAGGTVSFRQRGEDLLQVLEPDGIPLVWERCNPADLNA